MSRYSTPLNTPSDFMMTGAPAHTGLVARPHIVAQKLSSVVQSRSNGKTIKPVSLQEMLLYPCSPSPFCECREHSPPLVTPETKKIWDDMPTATEAKPARTPDDHKEDFDDFQSLLVDDAGKIDMSTVTTSPERSPTSFSSDSPWSDTSYFTAVDIENFDESIIAEPTSSPTTIVPVLPPPATTPKRAFADTVIYAASVVFNITVDTVADRHEMYSRITEIFQRPSYIDMHAVRGCMRKMALVTFEVTWRKVRVLNARECCTYADPRTHRDRRSGLQQNAKRIQTKCRHTAHPR